MACERSQAYPLPEGDWRPLIAAVLEDLAQGAAPGWIAARFHNALVEWIVRVAVEAGVGQVVLTGGVFQNRYLTEHAMDAAGAAGLSGVHAPAGAAERRRYLAGTGGAGRRKGVLRCVWRSRVKLWKCRKPRAPR